MPYLAASVITCSINDGCALSPSISMANERDSVSAIFASNVVVTVLYVISLSFDRWELLAWVADSLSAVLYARACSQRLAMP